MLVEKEMLINWLKEDDLVVIDVRADLQDETYGQYVYEKGHIPRAQFLDLEIDLSGPVQKHGGNHPLPPLDTFSKKLGTIGISGDERVVVYDEGGGMFAPRAWFLLRHVGLTKVYILNGGFKAWEKAQYPITTKQGEVTDKAFTPRINETEIVRMEEVKNRKESSILIDSRAPERYRGEVEPLYARAGHIPGAVNYFWEEVFTKDGLLKDVDKLKNHFNDLPRDKEIIVSCGSGVSACANLFALRKLGYQQVKLYAGSFSDWISYADNPIDSKQKLND